MNLALFYDTETTDLPNWHVPSDDPSQPHIVQLAAALVDLDSRKTISSMDVIIYPHEWEIPEQSTQVHGISTDFARQVGVPESAAIEMLRDLASNDNGLHMRAGHNIKFDERILRIAMMRYLSRETADNYKDHQLYCTMSQSTSIVNLPPTQKMIAAGRKHPKSPTLEEAYQYFFGKPMQNAHNAMADVQATIDVYFAIQDYHANHAS